MGNFTAVDHMIYDALTDARANIHMGVTAEKHRQEIQTLPAKSRMLSDMHRSRRRSLP